MCKEVKLSAQAFGIKPVGKFLCLCNVADLEKRIIIHLVGDVVFIKDMFHHFTAIDVDLNEEREPCLELDMHEAEMPVKEIEVIVFTFAVYSIKGEQAVVMLFGLEGLAVFHDREDVDEPLIYRLILKEL